MLEESYETFLDFDGVYPLDQLYQDQIQEYSKCVNSNRNHYPDLSQYIKTLDNNVEKLLNAPNIFHLIQMHHPQIINFLCQNIESLILLSFDRTPEKSRLSKSSFTILCSFEPSIHGTLINSDKQILQKMSNYALQANDDSYSLQKITHLIQFTIQLSYYWEKTFPFSLSFICIFIPYIYEDSIFNLYEQICSEQEVFIPAQEWLLKEASFPMIIIDELSSVKLSGLKDNSDKPKYALSLDKETKKAINLFRIVSACLRTKLLKNDFYNYRIIEILNDDWTSLKITDSLFDELWSTIPSLYTKETAPLMQGIFQKAIEIMTEPYTILKRFRIGVIYLISKMILIDETLIPYIVSSHIEETVLRLLIQFPGHSFMQNALLSLCQNALEVTEMRYIFARFLISPLIHESKKEKEGRFFIGFTCELIQKALDVGQSDKKFAADLKSFDGFSSFLNDVIKKRNKLMKNGYGGRLPIFKARPLVYAS